MNHSTTDRALRYCTPLVLALIVVAVAVAVVTRDGHVGAASPAGPIDLVALDTDVTGNTATSLGPIDECRQIDSTPGTTVTIDVVGPTSSATSTPTPTVTPLPTVTPPSPQPPVNSIDLVTIDTDVTGNTATSLGPIDECRQIDSTPGTTVTIDVVVDEIPAFDGLAGGIIGYQFTLGYDPQVFHVVDPLENQMHLAANGIDAVDFSDARPDSDGELVVAVADLGDTTPEDGLGVLARINLEVQESPPSGVTHLTIGGLIELVDNDSNVYNIGNIENARLSLSSPCPVEPTPGPVSHTPPPATPTPAPTATATATPLPPGEVSDLVVGSATVPPSGTVTIPVTVTASDLGSYRVDVAYDPAFVTATDCASTHGVCSIDTVGPNTVRIIGSNLLGISGNDIVLGTITLMAGDTEVMTHLVVDWLTLLFSGTEGDSLTMDHVTNGTITISSASPTPTPTATPQPPEPSGTPTPQPSDDGGEPAGGGGSDGAGDPLEIELLSGLKGTFDPRAGAAWLGGMIHCSEAATLTVFGSLTQMTGRG